MDVQQGVVGQYGDEGVLDRLERALDAARQAGILVIFVRVVFRRGFAEVSPNNKSFSAIASTGSDAMTETGEGGVIHPRVAPRPDEPIVTKRRVSGFTGSDLEVVLRSQSIDHMVLTGIATSGVVLSTLREAADRDYRLTVISDCCADNDDEVHRVLTEKLFPRQAEVVTVDEWVRTIS
jgi:nicotinamidase-related amidase